jgi:uncharacterized protein YbbC (DUF1343 family)
MTVKTGIDVLQKNLPDFMKNKTVALLANPASVNKNLIHSKTIISEIFKDKLTAIFSPQHGFYAEKQDNMIFSDHLYDPVLNIPVYSLYNENLKPAPEMLKNTDILIIDLQDVGTRVYTFIYTISFCLEAAKENNIKIVILDRPNPVSGNQVEGNILEPEYSSFVGRYPIPMRHGLTCAEFAFFINNEFNINADIEIIKMEGWNRKMYFEDTKLPWVLPSPNLPVPESAYVYPGQVIFEGTNISEGRGTTKPFELFGAPFIKPEKLKKFIIDRYDHKGVFLRETAFEPTSGKWSGERCFGFQIHIIDKGLYRPYFLSLCLLQGICTLFRDDFRLKQPPYEFEYEKTPLDLILGSKKLRKDIEQDKNLYINEKKFNEEIKAYTTKTKPYLLY